MIDKTELELVQPEYSKIKHQILYRTNIKGSRFYFNDFDDGIHIFPSVTHILDKTIAEKYVLIELIDNLGKDKYYEMMRTKACYGTIMHRAINEYLISGSDYNQRNINAERIKTLIEEETVKSRVEASVSKYWLEDLKADVICLIRFLSENNVEPLAIEMSGYYKDDKYCFAGAIDLVCNMDIEVKGFFGETFKSGVQKGSPKETKQIQRVTAIVDYKSGKKGFYKSHEVQVNMYKMIVESLGIKIDKCFNVSPNETSTNYKMKDQTEAVPLEKINGILQTFFSDYKEPKYIEFTPDTLTAQTDKIKIDIKDHLKDLIQKKNIYKLIA